MKKIVYGIAGVIILNGCVLKSKIIKELAPVDNAMIQIAKFDCSIFQVGTDPYIKCELVKTNAGLAHKVFEELGVKPIQ